MLGRCEILKCEILRCEILRHGHKYWPRDEYLKSLSKVFVQSNAIVTILQPAVDLLMELNSHELTPQDLGALIVMSPKAHALHAQMQRLVLELGVQVAQALYLWHCQDKMQAGKRDDANRVWESGRGGLSHCHVDLIPPQESGSSRI